MLRHAINIWNGYLGSPVFKNRETRKTCLIIVDLEKKFKK